MKFRALLAVGLMAFQAAVAPIAIANLAQSQSGGVVTGFVIPNKVGANQPFTFAAGGVVEGEVIAVRTVEGTVVQSRKADKLGRVFLAGGLAAGAYILSAKGGKNTTTLNVQPPQPINSGGLTIPDVPGCIDVNQGLSLSGSGMSGNAADMSVKISKADFPVLAGTASELKTGPLPTTVCGEGSVIITNNQTGDTSSLENVVCYELTAKLARQKLTGGEQTTLEFSFKPANFIANVHARILSGPVSFQGSTKEKDFQVKNGAGKVPLVADPAGLGQFRVAYDINEILGAGKLDGSTFLPLKPGGFGGEKPDKADNQKKKGCPKTKHIRDEANGWEQSEKKVKDEATGKEKTVYIISRTIRCSIHKSCSKDEGHGGNCAFTGKSRCEVHDMTETREFDNERDRKDSMKDTAIPDKYKYPA